MTTPWRPEPTGLPDPAPDGSPAAGSIRHPIRRIRAALLWIILGMLPLALLTMPGPIVCSQRASNERNASSTLRTLGFAQSDYRANDRDGNGIEDYWRQDVAGLYGFCPEGSDERIKLIELSAAGADDRPLTDVSSDSPSCPKAGYWYRALLHADEKAPDPDRFAFCCFPDRYGKGGRWTFILDETNRIYRKDLGRPGGIETYPADPAAEGWSPPE